MSSQGQGQSGSIETKTWPLSEAVGQAESQVEAIEQKLGLNQDGPGAKPQPGYEDVPRRLSELIARLVFVGKRLEQIKIAVQQVGETVG